MKILSAVMSLISKLALFIAAIALLALTCTGILCIAYGHVLLGVACLWLVGVTVVLTFVACAGAQNKRLDEIEERRAAEASKSQRLDQYA